MGFVVAFAVFLLGVCQAQMILESSAFRNNGSIPVDFGCDENERDMFVASVPLTWRRPPAKAQSFVLMMDDIAERKIHWLVKDIPQDVDELAPDASETNMPTGCIEMPNSFGVDSYSAPCPDRGTHRYRFRLYAMPTTKTPLEFDKDPEMLTPDVVEAKLQTTSLYVAVLYGRYHLKDIRFTNRSLVVEGSSNAPASPASSADKSFFIGVANSSSTSETSGTTETRTIISARQNASSRAEAERKVEVGERLALHRYIKPSEVVRRKAIGVEGMGGKGKFVCKGFVGKTLDECMVALQSEQVENPWDCKDNSRVHTGVQFKNHVSTRCSAKVRVGSTSCSNPVLPLQYGCPAPHNHFKTGRSVPVVWTDLPEHTQSVVVMMESLDDGEAKGNVTWLVTNIGVDAPGIAAGASLKDQMPPLSVELLNSDQSRGYTPPCPSSRHQVSQTRLHLFAMPHQTTKLFLPRSTVKAYDVIDQLSRLALCWSHSDYLFSFEVSEQVREGVTDPVVSAHVGGDERIPGEI